MNKHNLTFLSFATLLCLMLFGTTSCKKDETPDPNDADYFIDVDFLPESETNGEAAPRLMANFNDEMVMIELRPSADTMLETMLFLCPDNEALMICGNDSLMICAAYDMETNTPSRDVLLVTPMDDNALVITQCFIDWNTNTISTGDMMVLPIDDSSKSYGNKGGNESNMRIFFMNHLIKPLVDRFEKVESIAGGLGLKRTKMVFSTFRYMLTTAAPIQLFSDDPELLMEYMEYPIVTGTAELAQKGVLRIFPQKYRDMASQIVSGLGWFTAGGYGKVNNYAGGTNYLSCGPVLSQAYNLTNISTPAIPNPMYYVNLNVGNVTENSVYLKGSFRFGYNSSATPVEMGYIIKISGGPEQTYNDMYFNGITISGLQKATKYTAYAYVKSAFGDRVLSPGVTFWTLGFEAFPTSLSFPKEGDTKNVALSYSEQDITHWEVTSKPSWCAVTKDNLGLLAVKVGRTSEARSGTITITAYSNALGSITQDITVTQFGENSWSWDGTFWTFVGVITTNGPEGYSSSDEMTFTLGVNSVSANNIEFSFAQALSYAANGYSDNYILDGNGNLKYTANANGTDTHANCQVTFIRTGATSATANFSYHESGGGLTLTASGTLQGTLLNAKEVKGNESIINFNSPIFNDKVLKNSGELR